MAQYSRTPQMSDISWGINVSNFCIAFQCKTPRFGEVILQSRVWNRGTQKFTFSLTDVNHLYRTVPPVLAMLNLPQQSRSILSKYRICIPQLINTCLICVVRFGAAESSRTSQMSDITWGINVSNFSFAFLV